MTRIRVKCGFCHKEFEKDLRHVNENRKLGHKSYCSQKCLADSHLRRKTLICENPQCQKHFERSFGDISPHNFCSQSCSATVSNLSKSKKIRICANPKCQREFYGYNKYCSQPCVPKTQPKYSRENLLDKIRRFHQLHKRIPIKKEFYSNWQAYRRIFGSWNKAVKEAGFTPNADRFTHKYIARDGHICDSLSEKIIDNWLTSHKLFHEHGAYYPGQTKFKTDFLVSGKFWIEFPGLLGQLERYDKLYSEKVEITKKLGIKIVEILPSDIFPKNQLDTRLGFLVQ